MTAQEPATKDEAKKPIQTMWDATKLQITRVLVSSLTTVLSAEAATAFWMASKSDPLFWKGLAVVFAASTLTAAGTAIHGMRDLKKNLSSVPSP